MPLAADVEICGSDGVWRVLPVTLALPNRGKKKMRCVVCRGGVVLHEPSKDGKKAAHAEHQARWAGCPRSDEYDQGGVRPHPVQVR